jgi:hypothetical protein
MGCIEERRALKARRTRRQFLLFYAIAIPLAPLLSVLIAALTYESVRSKANPYDTHPLEQNEIKKGRMKV